MPLIPQIIVTAAWLGAYLAFSVMYHRRWDAAVRAWLGRRIGAPVGWTEYAGSTDPFSTESSPGFVGWGVGEHATLGQRFAVRLADLVAGIVFGAAPVLLYIVGLFFTGLVNPLVGLIAIFAFLPIFSVFWAGKYRLHRHSA